MRLVVAALAAMAAPASAQTICMGYADAVSDLQTKHGEAITITGLAEGGNVIAMFANPDTGTWTMIVVHPTGLACYLAHGTNAETHKPKPNL